MSERKVFAKVESAAIQIGRHRTDAGQAVTCQSSSFRDAESGRVILGRDEALIIEGRDGLARISVRRISW
jgi:hypothetical protein